MKNETIAILPRSNKIDPLGFFYKYGLYVLLVALVLIFAQFNDNFLTIRNLTNLLLQASTIGLASVGLTFVMITGGIDISLSAVMYASAIVVATLSNMGAGFFTCLIATMICGSIFGCINGLLIVKLKLSPLIATLAMMFVIRGLAIAVVGINPIFFNNEVSALVTMTRVLGLLPIGVIILFIALAASTIILKKTSFGRQLYAIGNNKLVAERIGISVNRNVFISYFLCGLFTGLAGLASAAQIGAVVPNFAMGTEFIIISSTVLGGVSLFGGKGNSFPGAFTGVIIMLTIENGLVMASANMYLYSIVRGIVIFAAVFLDSLQNKGELR